MTFFGTIWNGFKKLLQMKNENRAARVQIFAMEMLAINENPGVFVRQNMFWGIFVIFFRIKQ